MTTKPRAHLVTLDPQSIAGRMFLEGNNDGTTTVGQLKCPVLHCKSIAMDNPIGLSVVRTPLSGTPKEQSLIIPFSAVALIFDWYGEENAFGFASR